MFRRNLHTVSHCWIDYEVGITMACVSFFTCLFRKYSFYDSELGGWPFVFYFTGTFSLVWCIFWSLLAYDNPNSHPWITNEEREYITKSLQVNDEENDKKVPWQAILKSKCVWGCVAGHLASNWGNYQLNSLLPTYLSTVLQYVQVRY